MIVSLHILFSFIGASVVRMSQGACNCHEGNPSDCPQSECDGSTTQLTVSTKYSTQKQVPRDYLKIITSTPAQLREYTIKKLAEQENLSRKPVSYGFIPLPISIPLSVSKVVKEFDAENLEFTKEKQHEAKNLFLTSKKTPNNFTENSFTTTASGMMQTTTPIMEATVTTQTTTTTEIDTSGLYREKRFSTSNLNGLDSIVADVSKPGDANKSGSENSEAEGSNMNKTETNFKNGEFKPKVISAGYKTNPRFAPEEVNVEDDKCNDDDLLKLLIDNIQVDDNVGSKRSIVASLEENGASQVSIMCSEMKMAFRIIARKYCQLQAGTITCLAFIL